MRVGELASDTLDMFVTSVEYTEEGDVPVIHIFGRDAEGERHHVEVVGHRPAFFARTEAIHDKVQNHYAVMGVEDGYSGLEGENLTRIETALPKHVGELRDLFDETWEADVLYDTRFLVDTGIKDGVRIDTSETHDRTQHGDVRVSVDDVDPIEPPHQDGRVLTVDIEVASDSGFPDADRADHPVVAITAHDSYDDDYWSWLLVPDGDMDWDDLYDDVEDVADYSMLWDDEKELLDHFNDTVADIEPDILTGWYSNDFDIPYLVNRCRELGVWSYYDWSPLGEVFLTTYEPVVKGVECVDMLGAYKKTQIHNLTSESLESVATDELGVGKEDVVDGHAEMWRESPEEYLEYNRKDVELVVELAAETGAIDLLDHIRSIVGCHYTDPIGGNYEVMDTLFLRRAPEYGYRLPTAEKPEKDWYYGAKVFEPSAGINNHVIYLDVASLYPSAIQMLNVSPETLVGVEEPDAEHVHGYIDTRPDNIKGESEPEPEPCYYRTDEEGFVASLVDELIEMKEKYRGTGSYEAVKRCVNSVYGTLSDADSYGNGFRLFDWRMGESICLSGRKIITQCRDLALEWCDENGYGDAYVALGDTDAVGLSVPSAETPEEALDVGRSCQKYINDNIGQWCADEFGLDDPSDSTIEIECESYSSRIFVKGDDDGHSDVGTRKRYAQRVEWDDDDGWLDEPETDIVGFEYVRSDVAQVTVEAQKRFFDLVLTKTPSEAEESFRTYVSGLIADCMTDRDLNDIGIPMGIGQPLSEYGSPDRRPQFKYRGAKYANQYIYGENVIGEGDRPLELRVDAVVGDQRKTFKADTAEDGDSVDCVSVLDASDVPDEIVIDRRRMVEKTIISPLEPLVRTMGWDVQMLENALDDATDPSYWRDADQAGLSAEHYM